MKAHIFISTAGAALMLSMAAYSAPAVATNPTSQLSGIHAGTLGATNSNCQANCIKYFRQGDKLRLVILDENAKIFTVRTVPLPRDAKLTYSYYEKGLNGGTARTNLSTPAGKEPGDAWATSEVQQYEYSHDRIHYIRTITTTKAFYVKANGRSKMVDAWVYPHTIKLDTKTK